MRYPGLRYEVRQFCSAPLVAVEGQMDAWQFDMLRSLLHSFKWKGHTDVIVDLTKMSMKGSDSSRALADAVKTWNLDMTAHVVATGAVASALSGGVFPLRAHLCSSLDEAAEYICRLRRTPDYGYDTNIERQSVIELPLAA